MPSRQKGYLIIVAIVVTTLFSILVMALMTLLRHNIQQSQWLEKIPSANAATENALGLALAKLSTLDIYNTYSAYGAAVPLRSSCHSFSILNGRPMNIAVPGGSVTFGSWNNNAMSPLGPSYLSAQLSQSISATSTSIVLVDSSQFAPFGFVMIGREVIYYKSNDGRRTLSNLTRGVQNTVPTSQTYGATVSQYQCLLDATSKITINHTQYSGQFSNVYFSNYIVNEDVSREYQQAFRLPMLMAAGSNGSLFKWNDALSSITPNGFSRTVVSAELLWDSQVIDSSTRILSVKPLNYGTMWATGIGKASNPYYAGIYTLGSGFIYNSNLNTWTFPSWLLSTTQFTSNAQAIAGNVTPNTVPNVMTVYPVSESEAWMIMGVKSSGITGINKFCASGAPAYALSQYAFNAFTNGWNSPMTLSPTSGYCPTFSSIDMYDYTGDGFADIGFIGGAGQSSGSGSLKGVLWFYATANGATPATRWVELTTAQLN